MKEKRATVVMKKNAAFVQVAVNHVGGVGFCERGADGLAHVESFENLEWAAGHALLERDSGIMLHDENRATFAFESFQDARKRRLVDLAQTRGHIRGSIASLPCFASHGAGPQPNRCPVGAAARLRVEATTVDVGPFEYLEVIQARHALFLLGGDRT